MPQLCPQLKQNLANINSLKSELDLELPKLKELFKIFKNNTDSKIRKDNKTERKNLINKIKSLKTEINLNIEIIEDLTPIKIISAVSLEGKEIKFELKEQLKYWNDFYKDNDVDWVSLPEKIKITKDQQKEIERLITEFGFNKMIIIPENMAATGADYEKLHSLMSKDYVETWQSSDFKADSSFAGLKNKSDKLRIVLTKDIKELDDDNLFKQTLNKKMDELEAPDGIFAENELRGLDIATYLIYQKEYFKRTGKHLDEDGWTWLPEQIRAASGRGPRGGWDSGGGRLVFHAGIPDGHGSSLGCRLAGSFEV
jgi:hypothetical protein